MPDTVKATYVGPPDHFLDDGVNPRVDLVPGVTVVEIGAHEAEASDNWRVSKRKPRSSKAKKAPKAKAAADSGQAPQGAPEGDQGEGDS